MSYLSDKKGNMDYLDFGDVTLIEAATSTAFFVALAAAFSNFNVTIPIGGGNTINMSHVLFSLDIPVLGTLVAKLGVTIATILFLWQVVDAAVHFGRSNDPTVKKWYKSIPTGLTLGVGGVVIAHLAALMEYAPIMDALTGNLLVEFGVVAVGTAVYWAIASQG